MSAGTVGGSGAGTGIETGAGIDTENDTGTGTGAPGTQLPGRVQVHERAIGKVVAQASAHAIGVTRDEVHAEVSEWGGGLAVRLSAKLPIPDLADTEAIRAQTPVFERMRAAQAELAHDLERMTGRAIRRISVTVNGAVVTERKRVR
ncbi:NTP pyrophosphohydrolase [Leucobacter sp. USCH14]|uniref:NTP pyrophosphohydrolase n=1 Tax=Leucobacter sp. USCH14 TaxID=3024838 RepID=UPI003098DD8E